MHFAVRFMETSDSRPPQLRPMNASRSCGSISRNSLQTLFLRDVLAAGAGTKVGTQSLESLSILGRELSYSEFRDNLRVYFRSLKPYRKFGDFQGLDELPTPSPLQLFVEPSILQGHFRAWLRRRGSGVSGEVDGEK